MVCVREKGLRCETQSEDLTGVDWNLLKCDATNEC